MTKAKSILLDELKEQSHSERVEDVIFWALEHYAKSGPRTTIGMLIAHSIKERILEAEQGKEQRRSVKEWLEEAKANGYDWADKAIRNMNNDFRHNKEHITGDKLSSALLTAFLFCETPEGDIYWQDILRKLKFEGK
jgi:transcriptional regulatory protein LevR